MNLKAFVELCSELETEIEAEMVPDLEEVDEEPDSDIALEFLEIFEDR